MLNAKFSKILHWSWDILSTLGAKPYPKIAAWLAVTAVAVAMMPPLIWVIYLVILPLWCSTKYCIKNASWPWYVLSVLSVLVWIFTTQFVNMFAFVFNAIILFACACAGGKIFNKFIAPALANALAEMLVQQEIEAGTFNYEEHSEIESKGEDDCEE